MPQTFALALHGGAGTLPKPQMTKEKAAAYHASLTVAMEAGSAVLSDGGTALDAVTAAVCALEDEPLFNAGRGAVFTSAGTHEMDAAIMDGATLNSGAVAGLFGPKNPVRAARAVMETTEHVLMLGEGANGVAQAAGIPFEGKDYFFTQARWDALQTTLAMRESGKLDDDPARRHGTVGAVALDQAGNLAAATSTGGMTAKTPGRVGDTPIVGAGTFAENATCAVSATGDGEFFIRHRVAGEISARMRHLGESLEAAADYVVMQTLGRLHPDSGGLVAIDRCGRIAMPFNCEGMYRGVVVGNDAPATFIYR